MKNRVEYVPVVWKEVLPVSVREALRDVLLLKRVA